MFFPVYQFLFVYLFFKVKFRYSEMHRSKIYNLMSLDKFIYPCNHHPNQDKAHFHESSRCPHAPFCSIPIPFRQSLSWFPLSQISFTCSSTSYKWNHSVVFFCVWPFGLNMFLMFIYVVAYISSSFFYCWVIFHLVSMPQSVYSFSYWWTFGFFQLLTLMNKATKNIFSHVFL